MLKYGEFYELFILMGIMTGTGLMTIKWVTPSTLKYNAKECTATLEMLCLLLITVKGTLLISVGSSSMVGLGRQDHKRVD